MSDLPEDPPREPEIQSGGEFVQPTPVDAGSLVPPHMPPAFTSTPPPGPEQPLFVSYTQPPVRRPVRIPHFGHFLLLSLFLGIAFSFTIAAIGLAVHLHLFGWQLSPKLATNLGLNLISMVLLYLIAFGFSFFVFPMIWNEGYFTGLQWHGSVARARFAPLVAIAFGCLSLAWLDQIAMPGPTNAPIDKMISSTGNAWLMFAFGVTFAPFFEEMFFRGFLLPALCTAFDWIAEKNSAGSPIVVGATGRPQWSGNGLTVAILVFVSPLAFATHLPLLVGLLVRVSVVVSILIVLIRAAKAPSGDNSRWIDASGHPLWSLPAMIVASIATSIPFALLHVAQQGHAWGPFLLLIVISLILCAVRLKFRSLAASTLVHASYNFFIFTLTLIGTSGFHHFDKV